MKTIKVFIGFDERQRVSFTTLASSIYEHSASPISITPLILRTLPITRRGLTPFTFSRFLVPWLCDYEGIGIFMDADMLLTSDIGEVANSIEAHHAVAVVRNIALFEQTSFMAFNCEHESNKKLTPEYIESTDDQLLGLDWVKEDQILDLDSKWNQLIGYQQTDEQSGNLHFTMGIPAYKETSTCDHKDLWEAQLRLASSSVPWVEIMGRSVHSVEIDGVKLPKYVWDFEKNQPKIEHLELIKRCVSDKVVEETR